MLRDVFYFGKKPNVHPREQYAENLNDARLKATTRDFWIINEFCDYRNFDWDFDFEFLPDEDVWAEDHNNVWPSQHQKDSGTWLCPKSHSDIIIYRNDVNPVIRKNEHNENWVELDLIDHSKFDFSWHPDPTDPPYIYKWGCKYFPAEFKHVLEYRVPGATQEKYMNITVELLPETDRWVEYQRVDKEHFDLAWRPSPLDPAFIYVWGNKYIDGKLKPTIEYHMDGATDKKYMPELVPVLPEWDKWVEVQEVDKSNFDFSWRPDPREPAYIYTWGNKWIDAEFIPTLEYHCEGATERKYMTNDVPVLPERDKWKIIEDIVPNSFDFSWRPDPREPALIYVFGNEIFDAVKMPTVEYHCEGATERKYIDTLVAKLAPNPNRFEHLEDSFLLDYSWLPDPDSPPYIYAWGNQWNSPEDKVSVQFVVPGATEYKYMTARAIRKPCMDNWIIPDDVDTTGFDFSWEPSPAAPPYIYEFATQWQKTGGPQYVVPGATEKQYVDFQKVIKLPSNEGWSIPSNIDSSGFDFSWHPDATSPPYVYIFATQWAFSGGPVYTVPGATEIKYVDDQIATAKVDMTNWVYDPSLIDTASFDFSWHPYVEDQPYIYEFGTQWQKTGGPKYITPGADSSSPTKYIDTRILKAKRLPNSTDSNWKILNDYKIKAFDFSWHPDSTEEPYIYVFGNNLYPAEEMPTIEYHVPNAKQVKFVNDVIAVLDQELTNWVIPDDVDTTGFDFSWKPNPTDPAYIYEFGTQHQKTGGPRYVVPGATETKYLDFQTVTRKAVRDDNWKVIEGIDVTKFDFSWHPDATDPAYIYAWGNQWVNAEDRPSIEYIVPGATEYRYMGNSASRLPVKDSWIIPDDADCSQFDFSWEPSPKEEPYIYQFGTQWQKTGGPKFIVDGATEVKYVDTFTATKLADESKFTNNGYKIKDFDYSWHPDDTEEPYIYVFGNNLYPAEECPTIEYRVENATEVKYVNDIVATLDSNVDNWIIPDNIDTTNFDFSWVPNPTDPAFVYEFGTQHQKTGGPKFVVEGATEIKYLDFQRVTHKVTKDVWDIPDNIDVTDFDFSWHPDNTDPAYIYQFGTQWALSGGPRYVVEGATEIKYMDNLVAKALPTRDNWVYDETKIDVESFDFSWHPYVEDQPYIYEFGTQHQKTGGPRYITPGADSSSPIKYIDTRILKATRLSNKSDSNWKFLFEIEDFDFSWHPDDTDEPYIYVFGNTQYSAEDMPTVEYRVPNATQVKYVHGVSAKLAPCKDNWVIHTAIDEEKFDFSWRPHPKDPAYIYRWGNKYVSNKYEPTIEYVVPGATEIKYMTDDVVVLPEADRWFVPKGIDVSNFDFTWRPDPLEPPQVYQFATQWQKTGGPVYTFPGATTVKYIDFQKARHLPKQKNWVVPDNVDATDFDFSWHPDDTSPPYIYVFPTKWALSGGPRYVVPGATQTKYVETDTPANVLPSKANWEYDAGIIDAENFDFSWHPYDEDQPYIYQFGTQWQKTGGPRYIAPGATNNSPVKYVDTRIIKATRLPDKKNWSVVEGLVVEDFDYSWHPDETETPYIYVFGNTQYGAEDMPTVQYTVPGATEIKYVHDVVAKLGKNMNNWEVPSNIDTNDFDFGWVPHPKSPPYIYEFATVWNNRGGPRYVVPGATEFKYVDDIKAKLVPSKDNWEVDEDVDVKLFDFSWVPHPEAPPYIYQFGTILDKNDGPRYVTPGNDGEVVYRERVEIEETDKLPVYRYYIETTLEDLINQHPDEMFWAMRKNINYDDFDFSWRPDIEQAQYVHAFGSADSELTQTYLVSAPQWINGNRDFNWIENVELTEESLVELFVKPDMFYVDRGNSEANSRFEALKAKYGTRIQKTRYLNSWVDTINRCSNRATSDVFWVLNSELDYTDFNFDYYPNPWQMKMVHVFGTQWSHWGTTFMVNRESFREDTKYIKIIEHLSNLNFVKDIRAKATQCVHDIVVIDHGNPELTNVLDIVNSKASGRNVTTVVYNGSYLDTLKDIVKRQQEKKEHYIWVCSSVCDYTEFDFSYICDPFARDNLHVFPSGMQKFGDTFFVDVNLARELLSEIEKLDEYKINFNANVKAKRLPEPVIVTADDTHVVAAKNITGFPYATLITQDNIDIEETAIEPMNLWAPDTKNILITSTGGTRIVVPAEVKDHSTVELYEYPYIKRMPKLAKSKALDIVFVSNGETVADQNYEHLINVTNGLANKIHRIDGINGRTEALHAAAEASETPWFFGVPAKLLVNKKFDWNYQADRLQMPKHYIFNALNPVNDLFYGHQSMVLYNKNLVLGNKGVGLDFTLDSPHMAVELNSGIVVGDTDEYSTWRTAFREAVKLKKYSDNGDDTAKKRLAVWTSVGKGNYGEWSIKGALDGIEFYNEANGDLTTLRQSYYWDWLKTRFDSKY